MKTLHTATIVALSVVASLSIAAITGFQVNNIIAEETEKKSYNFAEDTTVTAVFYYSDGQVELIPFEVFTQKEGFDIQKEAVFELTKVTGKTPLLHAMADDSRKVSNTGERFDKVFLDVDVIISQGSEIVRKIDYNKCRIIDQKIDTLYDKEEAWFGKGFAVTDAFEFTCKGYNPSSPIYEQIKNSGEKANTKSSKDLKPTDQWNPQMKVN